MRIRVNDELILNYELAGDPSRQAVVVLTHGMGGSHASWEADVPELSSKYAILRWDVRGHGDSEKPDIPYDAAMHARDLAGLLEALDIGEVFCGGNSMGGAITQRFMLDFPEKVRAGFLLCTSSEVGAKMGGAWEERARTAETQGMEAMMEAQASLANANVSVQPASAEAQEAGREVTMKIPGKIYARIVRAMASYDWTAELTRIRVPVLILQGLQDTMTPPGGAVIIHRLIPQSQLVMMDQCSHAIQADQPEQWRRHLLNFLDGVESWYGAGLLATR